MARSFLLFLAAACCCCLALLPSPVQGRPGAGRDHRLLFPEQHFDVAEPTEQQGGLAVKKSTPSWSPPPPAEAGDVITPELRLVPGGSNPLHNYGGTTTRQDEERTPVAPPAAEGNAARPELRTTPWGANPLHN